eukprot:TRINITY_DN9134_c0_g1_i2.p1 TRINITY_DN9134_c0_g1~~TRINITY_DN9134_c0_g1_i2.p1  ORF type:complete len:282 (+),score=62.72 TRINITY_DN9134_c0_g1_i2:138-983(+)
MVVPVLVPKTNDPTVNAAKSFVTGMLAAQLAALCTNPIDVVKIRLQVQGEAAAGGTSQQRIGFLRQFQHITRTEGMMALMKGIWPSLLRETCYSSIRLSAYEPIRDRILSQRELLTGQVPFYKKFAAGASSGAIGAGLSNPADLVKVRMQAASSQQPYTSTRAALCRIYSEEGARGLFRGCLATVQRAAILTATQLGTYDHAKHVVRDDLQMMAEGPALHFVAGTTAGFFVAVTTRYVHELRGDCVWQSRGHGCLLYTSDAADEEDSVDLGGCRIIKKKKK